ncbi:hypothetical protein [Burkholderia gladioli]|uniref:hypothetical protein n=1 Tax=Burkholderia gladioli TaxID=28095 RepID=UPI001641B261|nr:hypothetical protein [Burkholderia gladioli]
MVNPTETARSVCADWAVSFLEDRDVYRLVDRVNLGKDRLDLHAQPALEHMVFRKKLMRTRLTFRKRRHVDASRKQQPAAVTWDADHRADCLVAEHARRLRPDNSNAAFHG